MHAGVEDRRDDLQLQGVQPAVRRRRGQRGGLGDSSRAGAGGDVQDRAQRRRQKQGTDQGAERELPAG